MAPGDFWNKATSRQRRCILMAANMLYTPDNISRLKWEELTAYIRYEIVLRWESE